MRRSTRQLAESEHISKQSQISYLKQSHTKLQDEVGPLKYKLDEALNTNLQKEA